MGNYGKWYIKPKDYQKSLENSLSEIKNKEYNKNQQKRQKELISNANFFLKNYQKLEQSQNFN